MSAVELWCERIVPSGGVDLLVHDGGSADHAVLFLHGLGGYSAEWALVAQSVCVHRRVIAFDQRGHGGSTRRPSALSREAHVHDVISVLDRLGLEEAAIVGHSAGAHTAMLTAARQPDRVTELVLIEGGPAGADKRATDDVISWFASWPCPFEDMPTAVAYFEDQYGPGTAATVWAAGLQSDGDGLVPAFDLDVIDEALRKIHSPDRWSEWDSITAPILLIKGERGFQSEAEVEAMLRRNQRARHVEIADAGHDVHLDRPTVVATQIENFLG